MWEENRGRVIMSPLCRKGELPREQHHLPSLQRWWNKPWLAVAEEIWGFSPADLITCPATDQVGAQIVCMSYQHKAGALSGWLRGSYSEMGWTESSREPCETWGKKGKAEMQGKKNPKEPSDPQSCISTNSWFTLVTFPIILLSWVLSVSRGSPCATTS